MKICENHQEYKVPLIGTMAFPYCEYWCPYCGVMGGMFDIGMPAEETEQLIGRQAIYKEYSEFFLNANGRLVCAKFKLNKGWVERKDMPEAMRKELAEIANNGWKYKIRAMEFIKGDDQPKELPDFSCSNCKFDDNDKEKRCKEAYTTDVCICGKWERETK